MGKVMKTEQSLNKEKINIIKKVPFVECAWSISAVLYIICMISFAGTGVSNLSFLNTITLYTFFITSIINILVRGKVKINYLTVSLILYGIMLFISWFYTPVQNIAITYLYKYITMVVISFCIVNFIDSTDKVKLIIKSYIIGGFILCLYSFSIYGFEVFNTVVSSKYLLRIGSEVGNSNTVGMTYAFSVVFSIYFLLYDHLKLRNKAFYIIIIAICSTFTLLSGSKKAVLLLILSIFLLVLFKPSNKNTILKKCKNIIIATLIVGVLIYLIQNLEIFNTINERMTDLFSFFTKGEGNESDQIRNNFIKYGLQVWSNNLFIGDGICSSYYYFGTYSHNNYVEILMNTGLIGFLLFYSPYLIFIYRLRKMGRSNQSLKILSIILILSYLILGHGMVYYYDRYAQVLIAVASTLLSSKSMVYKEEN